MKLLRARQKFGKYVIERRLGEGGFAVVYQARDTIEGIRVALKIPHAHLLTEESLEDFRREVRLIARLEHPNILPLKTAQFIDDQFVIVSSMGRMTLGDRLCRRLSVETAIGFARQMLAATAYAHRHKIVHCDIKPDNFILFDDNRLRLADFGVAQVARRTLRGDGAGTLGYMAPEQAMGRPSFRSDVFSLGLVLFRTFSGQLPEYPFDWPPRGYRQLQNKLARGYVDVLRRALHPTPRKRFVDAVAMANAFGRVRSRKTKSATSAAKTSSKRSKDWKTLQREQFLREFRKSLGPMYDCEACGGPVAEAMQACPWCGTARSIHRGGTQFPQECPRCRRGLKLDWTYCPWCHGPGFEKSSDRPFSDARYAARCHNSNCSRKLLMPFMRYCPWCRRKVRRKWRLPECNAACDRCGWGVASEYWSYCPWCVKPLSGG